MTDAQWFRHFLTHLCRDDDESFAQTVAWHLRAIRSEAHAGNVRARQSASAAYGGFLRADRGAMRAKLALALIDQLGITATQHVGNHILQSCFGLGMDCKVLDFYFATPGRDASVKHMKDAKQRLASRPDAQLRFAALYRWYCKAQERHVYRIKTGSRRRHPKEDARFQLPPQIQPTHYSASGFIPKVERFSRQLPLFPI